MPTPEETPRIQERRLEELGHTVQEQRTQVDALRKSIEALKAQSEKDAAGRAPPKY